MLPQHFAGENAFPPICRIERNKGGAFTFSIFIHFLARRPPQEKNIMVISPLSRKVIYPLTTRHPIPEVKKVFSWLLKVRRKKRLTVVLCVHTRRS
jgi:hypothetical protein